MAQGFENTVRRYYRVDRRQLNFLKFIFEAYDGVALLTTIDPGQGLVVVQIGPGSESVADRIIADLGKSIRIEPVETAL